MTILQISIAQNPVFVHHHNIQQILVNLTTNNHVYLYYLYLILGVPTILCSHATDILIGENTIVCQEYHDQVYTALFDYFPAIAGAENTRMTRKTTGSQIFWILQRYWYLFLPWWRIWHCTGVNLPVHIRVYISTSIMNAVGMIFAHTEVDTLKLPCQADLWALQGWRLRVS